MKKIFTLIAAAIVSLTAFAQQEVALSPKTMVEEATVASEMPMRAAVKRLAKPEQSMNARAAKKAMTAADIVGSYITFNDLYSSSYEYNYCTAATIAAGEGNTVIITGLYGQDAAYPIKGTVENGQLIIPCNQQISSNASYGKVALGVIAVNEAGTGLDLYNDEAHPITFNITEVGLMPIDTQYGVVRFIPEYGDGSYVLAPYMYDCMLIKPNATMTSELAKSSSDLSVGDTKVSPVYVDMGNGFATVYGFDGNLVSNIIFKTDGTCIVPASTPLYYFSTNKTYAYAYKATKSSSTGNWAYYNNTDPVGTYGGNTIEIGMWGLYSKSATGMTILNGRKLNSKIVLNEGELNVADYSALEGTYKVDAKVVVEGARQGEDLLEAQEISIKQNLYAGYIDVTLPACTSQGFSMAETVVSGIKVTAASTPGVYALSGEDFPIVIGGKTITASISNFGVLNTNDNTINMTVNATLPDNLGTMTVTYSMSKPKSITVDFSQFEGVDATGSTPIAAKEGVFSFVGNNSKVTLTASGFYTGGNSSSSARHIVVKPETDGILTVEGTASGDNTDRYIFVATAAGADENADNVLNKVAIPEKGVRHSFETELRGGNTYYVCLHGNGTITALSFQPGVITAVNSIVAPAKVNAAKFIENGKIVIVKNGKKFNVAGMKM